MAHFAIVNKKTCLVATVMVVPNNVIATQAQRLVSVRVTPFSDIFETVVRTVVIDNEKKGIDFLQQHFDISEEFAIVQTSFNSKFRYNFAGIDYTYNFEAEAFIAPMPAEAPVVIQDNKPITLIGEWQLNTNVYKWEFIEQQAQAFRRAASTQEQPTPPAPPQNVVLYKSTKQLGLYGYITHRRRWWQRLFAWCKAKINY